MAHRSSYTTNGPRAGRSTGRQRNTLINNASRVPPPPVSPGSAVAFGGQLAAAQMTLAQRLAAIRAQKGIIQGQFRMERAGVKSQAIAGISGAVNAALEAGTVGSSFDLEQRTGVRAEQAAGVQAAIQSRLQGLLGLRLERLGAVNEFYTTQFDIQARRAAEQAELANQAFLQDLVMRLGDETAPGTTIAGRPAAPGAPVAAPLSPQDQARIDWIRNRIASGRM